MRANPFVVFAMLAFGTHGCSGGARSSPADADGDAGQDALGDTASDTPIDSAHDTTADTPSDVESDTLPVLPSTCDVPVDLVDTTSPDRVVGDGSPASCNEASLRDAVAAGGVIAFACGADPVTISLSSQIHVSSDTVLDGGGLVTLSGGHTTRIIDMDTGNFEATGPDLTVQRLSFVDGRATGTAIPLGTDVDGGGGAIFYRGGSVTVIDCVFTGNAAAEVGPDVGGGAIYGIGVGETIVVGSLFTGNRGSNGGAIGALHTAVTLVNSALVANVATGWGANWVDEHGDQQGHGGNGGAIVMDGVGRTLEICGCDVSSNSAGAFGGALFRTGYEGEPTIIDLCSFDGNEVRDPGDLDMPCGAGGLYIQGTHVVMSATTVSNCSARSFAGLWILGHGSTTAVADLTNVTIADNWTFPADPFTERGIGGGLIMGDNTVGTILNCTIAGNAAQFASGIAGVSDLTVKNTIIANLADNEWTPLNCTGSSYDAPPGSGTDNVQWPVDSHGTDMECTPGILYADPLLGGLADNGGPTLTMMPGGSSPALSAGHGCPSVDQRGEPRNEPCTLGAVEVR